MSEDTVYTSVSVRIPRETRKKWEEYLPNSDAENLSHLIRMAVKHEIDGTAESSQSQQKAIFPEELGEIADGVTSLQQTMNDVQTRLSSIEEEMEVTELIDIQDAVFDVLPTPPSDSEQARLYGEWAMTAEEVSTKVAHSESTVRETLSRLEDRGGQVRSIWGGSEGKIHYYKRE